MKKYFSLIILAIIMSFVLFSCSFGGEDKPTTYSVTTQISQETLSKFEYGGGGVVFGEVNEFGSGTLDDYEFNEDKQISLAFKLKHGYSTTTSLLRTKAIMRTKDYLNLSESAQTQKFNEMQTLFNSYLQEGKTEDEAEELLLEHKDYGKYLAPTLNFVESEDERGMYYANIKLKKQDYVFEIQDDAIVEDFRTFVFYNLSNDEIEFKFNDEDDFTTMAMGASKQLKTSLAETDVILLKVKTKDFKLYNNLDYYYSTSHTYSPPSDNNKIIDAYKVESDTVPADETWYGIGNVYPHRYHYSYFGSTINYTHAVIAFDINYS